MTGKVASLERRVSELETEITELRAEGQARERHLVAVVHDLRGPLSMAKMCVQILRYDPGGPERRSELTELVEQALSGVDRMIHDLLDAARIRAGAYLPAAIRECDLTSITEELVAELKGLHGDRFVVRAEGRIRGFWSARDLHRVLWNLVTNAVKYGDAYLPITVRITRETSGVVIAVHNHGTPIPPDLQANLFDPFRGPRKTRTGTRTGWGLGLTLVRGCIAAHGGSVTVQSDAAAGTTFICRLPVDARVFQRPVEPKLSGPRLKAITSSDSRKRRDGNA